MPAINVSRTDTFETQRQKINEIGQNLFQIYQGGSDLSTGVLRIGDGTVGDPSLGFISDNTLGFYKSAPSTLGVVSTNKKIFDFEPKEAVSYQDFIVRRSSLLTTGLQITNPGSGYDEGIYTLVPGIGGTGQNSELTVTVIGYSGSITKPGENYNEGNYSTTLQGGTGSGSTVSFIVPGIAGDITNAGTGYIPGVYIAAPFSSNTGTGTNGTATIEVSGTTTLGAAITNNASGTGIGDGEYPGLTLLNSATQTFTITTVANLAGPPDNIYQVNGSDQAPITLISGNTYYFDISDVSNDGHPLAFAGPNDESLDTNAFVVTKFGGEGIANSIIELVVKPNAEAVQADLIYKCENHSGMGGTITITSGTPGYYGNGATATVTVGDSEAGITGEIVTVTIDATAGKNYLNGDVLTLHGPAFAIGSNTVAQFTVNSVSYDGTVVGVTPIAVGSDYDNGDVLTVANSNLGGAGSNFEYTLNVDPGSIGSFEFTAYGTGYTAGDQLILPVAVSEAASITSTEGDFEITIANLANIYIESGWGASGPNIPAGAVVDSFDLATNSVVLDVEPSGTGNSTITFTPPWGFKTGADAFEYTIGQVGVVDAVTVTNGGVGYTVGNTLSVSPGDLSASITKLVTAADVQELTFNPAVADTALAVDDVIRVKAGTIEGGTPTGTTTTSSGEFTAAQASTTGTGTGASFLVTRGDGGEEGALGEIVSIDIVDGGFGHALDDVITLNGNTVGGSTPADNITFLVESVTESTPATVRKINSAGGFITTMLVDGVGFAPADTIVEDGTTSPDFIVGTASTPSKRFFIDGVIHPDLTLYSGDTYVFNYTDTSVTGDGTQFKLSEVPDGEYYTVDNLTTTLTLGSDTATMSSVVGLSVGMAAAVTFGDGAFPSSTFIVDINGSTVTFSNPASAAGSATLTFTGTEYTNGVSVVANELTITVTDSTPNLYYYASSVPDAGGSDGDESLLTSDPNNPKTFGSGLSINVSAIQADDVSTFNVADGNVESLNLSISGTATIGTGSFTTTFSSPLGTITALTTSSITSGGDLSVTAPNTNFTSNVNVGTLLSFTEATGKVETSGEIKTLNKFNSNDLLFVENAEISTAPGTALILKPGSTADVTKVDSVTALKIPAGLESDKPATSEDGYIRFNTTTNQYEGYSATNGSWSSLGGVRDLDGNTTILAEESVGANDNTLWFINDNINTMKFTPEYQEFVNVKKIRSINTSAPAFTNWVANATLVTNEYVKYANSIFLVVSGGQAATSGSEPTDTSGNNFANGSAILRYFTSAVSFITYEEVSEVRIDPAGYTDLVVNNELRFSNNNITSTLNDIIIAPSSGKKVKLDIPTSLVLPVGDNNSKGSPEQGSVRYNTDDNQFEGYNGAQWGGLGGVKDIDQDTEIKAESAPGADEDTLFFRNGGNNTLRITQSAMEFDSMNTISSVDNDLNIQASEVNFNNLALTIDTDSVDTCFLLSSRSKFDIGLSSGLNTDHLVRFNNVGETIYNLGFGTGNDDNIVMLNSDLTNINYKAVRFNTARLELEKGLSNSGNATCYNKNTESSAKVIVTANNLTSGDKEIVEFLVIDDGTDVFFTDTNNVKTGADQITSTFDIDGSNNVRITLTLSDSVGLGDNVEVTVVNTVTKR